MVAAPNPVVKPPPDVLVVAAPVVTAATARELAVAGFQVSSMLFTVAVAHTGMVRLAVETEAGSPEGLYAVLKRVQFPAHWDWRAHQEGWMASWHQPHAAWRLYATTLHAHDAVAAVGIYGGEEGVTGPTINADKWKRTW